MSEYKNFPYKGEDINDLVFHIEQAKGLLDIFYKYAYCPASENKTVDAAYRLKEFYPVIESLQSLLIIIEGLSGYLAENKTEAHGK